MIAVRSGEAELLVQLLMRLFAYSAVPPSAARSGNRWLVPFVAPLGHNTRAGCQVIDPVAWGPLP
jgi:hypothetical protein